MVQYKLVYFDIRGRAEVARLIFHYAGVDFEDKRLAGDEWSTQFKKESLTGHCPMLFVDGEQIDESMTICRFLARRFNLVPKDDLENARIEMYVDFMGDLSGEVAKYIRIKIGRAQGDKDEAYEKNLKPAVATGFPVLTKVIKENGNKYLAKSGFTWADLFVGNSLFTFFKNCPEFAKDYPELFEYQKRIHAEPKLQVYLAKRKDTDV